ncbi:MAG: hypothetical protein AB7O38_17140 [Pirellulaceae bacterium]
MIYRALVFSLAALAGMVSASLPNPVSAQEDIRRSSLQWVPADVGFYSASLKLRQQVEQFLASRAVSRVAQQPLVQLGIAQLKANWENPPPSWQDALERLQRPDNQQLMAVLLDAVSHEVFLYGDTRWAEWVALSNRINAISRQAQLEAQAAGEDPAQAVQRRMLDEAWTMAEQLPLPDLVIGFRLTDQAAAKEQLDRLERIAGEYLHARPEWNGRLRRESVAGHDVLSLRVDGQLIPWERAGREIPDDQRAKWDKLVKTLSARTVYVSLCPYQDYLLLSFSADHEHLTKLGTGPLLADRPELAPVVATPDRPYLAIQYASGDFVQHINSVPQQLDNLIGSVEQLLQLAGLEATQRADVLADLKPMMQRVAKLAPRQGATTNFAWRTPRGIEAMTYQWTLGEWLSDSRPLTLLEHTGGALAFGVIQLHETPDLGELVETLWQRGWHHTDRLLAPRLTETERATYDRIRAEIVPIVERLGAAFRDKIGPALDGGQIALALDAQALSKRWHQQLPPSDEALPMLEPALVLEVRNADQLRSGAADSWRAIHDLLGKLHELFPEQVPAVALPVPSERDVAGGVIYYFPLPTALGLDSKLAPHAALGRDLLVFGLFPEQAERMLPRTDAPRDGLLVRRGPTAAAGYIQFAEWTQFLRLWANYGFQLAAQQENQAQVVAMIKEPAQAVLDLMQCLRTYTAVTYRDGPAAVTHGEWHVVDLP